MRHRDREGDVGQEPEDDRSDSGPSGTIAIWMAIGAGLGVAIGAALGNIALGIAIGVGLGTAIGIGLSQRQNR